jgi:hypothetical protein
MSTIARTSYHRNATAVIFDGGCLKADPIARETRARFGRGVLKSVPHDKRPYTQADLDEFSAMLRDRDTKPTPLPPITPDQLAAQISESIRQSQALGRRQDALWAKLHGIRPICGGAPTKFEPTEDDLADVFGSDKEPVHRASGDDDMAYIGAVG